MRSQSAMEYLMTYGWAILVIAVVLGILFQLGVFNTANLTPKAKAGQCQVQVLGSGSSTTHQLAGMCQGEEPEYVAKLPGTCNPCITLNPPSNPFPTAGTMAVWFNVLGTSSSPDQRFLDAGNSIISCCVWRLDSNPSSYVLGDPGSHSDISYSTPIAYDTWHFLAIAAQDSGSNTNYILYFDGQVVQSGTYTGVTISPITTALTAYYVNGYEADIQIYNTSLTAAELAALYQEGIGGAPVKPQNIVGWWPLNGNLNDYSGNDNNGQGAAVGYTSFWTTGYTAP